jgi:hypothetical protein
MVWLGKEAVSNVFKTQRTQRMTQKAAKATQ